jgi:hypothetical protein
MSTIHWIISNMNLKSSSPFVFALNKTTESLTPSLGT